MLVYQIKKDSIVVVIELNHNTDSSKIKYVGQVVGIADNSYKSIFIHCVDSLDCTSHKFADVMLQKGSEFKTIPHKKVDGVEQIILQINADLINCNELTKFNIDNDLITSMLQLFFDLDDNRNVIRLKNKFPQKPIVTTRTKKSLIYRLKTCINRKSFLSLHS